MRAAYPDSPALASAHAQETHAERRHVHHAATLLHRVCASVTSLRAYVGFPAADEQIGQLVRLWWSLDTVWRSAMITRGTQRRWSRFLARTGSNAVAIVVA